MSDWDSTQKVCIECKKVFDSCVKQVTLHKVRVSVTDVKPHSPYLPLCFVGCKSSQTKGIVDNLVVERLADKDKYGRIEADIVVPVQVTYLDSNNDEGVGSGSVVVPVNVVMYLPQTSVMPCDVEATVSAVGKRGTFCGTQNVDGVMYFNFDVDCSVNVILKLTMDVQLIVPAYGYAVPKCADDTQSAELPLYPD